MPHQLIEIILPEGRADDIFELLHGVEVMGSWQDRLEENRAGVHLLVESGMAESVLDILEPYLQTLPDARAVLLPVEATIPRSTAFSTVKPTTEEEQEEKKDLGRVSRHELYNDVSAGASLSTNYCIMVVLSATIAAIGLIRDDMAIIIGAMVLAPLLLPNVAFALANTLGDGELCRSAVKTALVGLSLSILMGILFGVVVTVDPSIPAVAARTRLGWSDLILALASGSAGVLALTGGGKLSLVGVMVAVALMPPLVTGGLMFGSGYYRQGLGGLNLAMANIICVNLAGIITFRLQGIRPSTWWENAAQCRVGGRRAIIAWTLMLLGLAGSLLFR
jgi:uncharacterized hydrophobic protein (TIGR00341 family)